MTARLRIAPRNFFDACALTTDGSPVSPLTNMQNTVRSRVWLDQDTATRKIFGLATRPYTTNMAALFRHRAHGAQIEWQFYSDNAWTTLVRTVGPEPATKVTVTDGYSWGDDPFGTGLQTDRFIAEAPWWAYYPDTTWQSFTITLSAFSSTFGATVWEIGRAWLGKYYETTRPPTFGEQISWQAVAERTRSLGASLRSSAHGMWRTETMDFSAIPEIERQFWLDIQRDAAFANDLFMSLYPEEGTRRERDHTMDVRFVNLNSLNREVNRSTTRIQIEEL